MPSTWISTLVGSRREEQENVVVSDRGITAQLYFSFTKLSQKCTSSSELVMPQKPCLIQVNHPQILMLKILPPPITYIFIKNTHSFVSVHGLLCQRLPYSFTFLLYSKYILVIKTMQQGLCLLNSSGFSKCKLVIIEVPHCKYTVLLEEI